MKKDNKDGKQSYILTRETFGMTILLFCALVLIALITHSAVFSSLGVAVCTFMYGTFGYGSFLVVAVLAYLGFWLVFEKKIKINPLVACTLSATVFMLFLLFHAVSTSNFGLEHSDFGSYLAQCYYSAESGYAGYTFGGVISALIVFPIAKGTTFIGAYVIFSILSVLCGYLTFLSIRSSLINKSAIAAVRDGKTTETSTGKTTERVVTETAQDKLYTVNEDYEIVNNAQPAQVNPAEINQSPTNVVQAPVEVTSDDADKFADKNLGRRILFENGEFAAESYRRNMIFNDDSYFNHPIHNDSDYLSSFSTVKPAINTTDTQRSYSESYSEQIERRDEEIITPAYVYGEKPVDRFDDVERDSDVEIISERDSQEEYSQVIREDCLRDDEIVEVVQPEQVQDDQDITELQDDDRAVEGEFRDGEYSDAVLAETDQSQVQDSFEDAELSDDEEYSQSIRHDEQELVDPASVRADNSLRNIFSAQNTGIPDGIIPDASRLTRRRDESRINIFDETDEDVTEVPDLGARGLRSDTVDAQDDALTERRCSPIELSDSTVDRTPVVEPVKQQDKQVVPDTEKGKDIVQVEPEKPKHVWKKYVRPTIDLLFDYPENNLTNVGEIEESKQIIIETLASFRIASHILNVIVGPAITRYDVVIEDKTNIKNALKYREAIAMALMKENVTAYLNYSKGAISYEVPNSNRATIGLKSMLTSSQFINSKPNSLTFALGKDVEGKANCPDITKMPHLLVAGTTGSGKSICLSSLIVSLLYKYGPDELRFILVDPKQSEFIPYENLPHLMINEIIFEVDKAIKALNWAIKEMERRYTLFKEMTIAGTLVKNINEYNSNLPEGEEKLPKIVVILDEFGDLMLQAKKDIESRIIRLVQKSRACGIHLILATQRPSVDCITGLIKSNLPTRIGFKVNSFDDSRTIFDIGGAEKLLGKGDLYFRSAENPELNRIQGCFIDSPEVQAVTDFVKKNNETYFDQSVSDFINKVEDDETDSSGGDEVGSDSDIKIDDKFIQALKFCVVSNQASVSMLQRRFPIGYVKACKIIDWMENMNYITQSEGSKPRKVLLSLDEFTRIYGDVDV